MVRPRTFKESLKGLEFDIQHANTLAAYHPRATDGVYFQLRLGYSSLAPFLLFLFKWTDCSLAGALGLMHILIYKVGGECTSMGTYEKRASLREFYGCLLPSLQQLQGGLTDFDIIRQKRLCSQKFEKRHVALPHSLSTSERETELEIEGECGICLESKRAKVVLPGCLHDMCGKCYKEWHTRCESCPFCRESLHKVDASDLWVVVDDGDRIDPDTLTRDNLQRLLLYIDRLPVSIADNVLAIYDARYR